MCFQSRLLSEVGEFTPIYQGVSLELHRGGELDRKDREKRVTGGDEERGAFCLHRQFIFQ